MVEKNHYLQWSFAIFNEKFVGWEVSRARTLLPLTNSDIKCLKTRLLGLIAFFDYQNIPEQRRKELPEFAPYRDNTISVAPPTWCFFYYISFYYSISLLEDQGLIDVQSPDSYCLTRSLPCSIVGSITSM